MIQLVLSTHMSNFLMSTVYGLIVYAVYEFGSPGCAVGLATFGVIEVVLVAADEIVDEIKKIKG